MCFRGTISIETGNVRIASVVSWWEIAAFWSLQCGTCQKQDLLKSSSYPHFTRAYCCSSNFLLPSGNTLSKYERPSRLFFYKRYLPIRKKLSKWNSISVVTASMRLFCLLGCGLTRLVPGRLSQLLSSLSRWARCSVRALLALEPTARISKPWWNVADISKEGKTLIAW